MSLFKIGNETYDLGTQTELEKTLYENLKVIGEAEKYKKQELSTIQTAKRTLGTLAEFNKQINDAMQNYKKDPINAILTKIGLDDLYNNMENLIGKTDSPYLKKLLRIYQNKIGAVHYAVSVYLAEPQNAAVIDEFKKKYKRLNYFPTLNFKSSNFGPPLPPTNQAITTIVPTNKITKIISSLDHLPKNPNDPPNDLVNKSIPPL